MTVLRALWNLVLLVLMPFLLVLNAMSLALTDLAWQLFGTRRVPERGSKRNIDRVSVVIPTWNARDLLEKYLPSVVAAARFHPGNEIIVVDNASEDGTTEMLREQFPSVRL